MKMKSFLGGIKNIFKRSFLVLSGVLLLASAMGRPALTIAENKAPGSGGDAVRIELIPSLVAVQPLGKVSYIANGYDVNGNLVDFGPNDLSWRTYGQVGTILKTGNNTATLTVATRANLYLNSLSLIHI